MTQTEMTPAEKERLVRFKKRINEQCARYIWDRIVELSVVDGGIIPPSINVKPKLPPRV